MYRWTGTHAHPLIWRCENVRSQLVWKRITAYEQNIAIQCELQQTAKRVGTRAHSGDADSTRAHSGDADSTRTAEQFYLLIKNSSKITPVILLSSPLTSKQVSPLSLW
jgi:hypothetical protein